MDTSAWFDLLVAGTPHHAAIVEVVSDPAVSLVTTTYVLDELCALLLVRTNHATAARAGITVRAAPEVTVTHPDQDEERGAWEFFLRRPDKTYTITDCLSFLTMRRLRIQTALATDDHFRQEGFTVLP